MTEIIITQPVAESRTDEEWERDNLEWALQHLDDAWSALIRAMYRDTRTVPGQYSMAIMAVRKAREDVKAMVEERGGTV